MAPFRILIVDDSVVVRKLLCEALSSDPQLEVVATASDGRIALAKIAQLHPDLITLDVEMPNMNGMETLVELRKLHPQLPVIMFSTLTERGAAATLDALSLGASDYVTKPIHSSGPTAAIATIQAELLPKIKALCARSPQKPVLVLPPRLAPAVRRTAHRRIEVVAIGTSTGGPNALAAVVPCIPRDFPVPIVIVQHMPPLFTRLLAERLTAHSQISVREGSTGTMLCPGQAWLAPGDFHMTVKRSGVSARLELNQDPPENSCRPAVDVLFHSVAEAYHGNCLAVVMTGMGADGVIGCRFIREQGGEVIVQDEASSVVWGMPGLVHSSGLADAVYPLDQLGQEITRRVLQSRTPSVPLTSDLHVTLEPRAK
jgi:two-component system, chemotaxis family, protein-glutamate methylesterase/glutaminase